MKGKWAAGISPRYFAWVIKDKLAVSERPGGYARNHRPVRRQEEIIWLREQGFARVVSLLISPHNLHAYEDYGLTWAHFPIIGPVEASRSFNDLFRNLRQWMIKGERLLIHEEELSDKVMGVVAGFLLWAEMVPSAPVAVTVIEKICKKQLGALGRQYVAVVDGLPRFDPIAEAEREAEQARKAAEEAEQAAAIQAQLDAEIQQRLAALAVEDPVAYPASVGVPDFVEPAEEPNLEPELEVTQTQPGSRAVFSQEAPGSEFLISQDEPGEDNYYPQDNQEVVAFSPTGEYSVQGDSSYLADSHERGGSEDSVQPPDLESPVTFSEPEVPENGDLENSPEMVGDQLQPSQDLVDR